MTGFEPLELEATALPTEPHLLMLNALCQLCFNLPLVPNRIFSLIVGKNSLDSFVIVAKTCPRPGYFLLQ